MGVQELTNSDILSRIYEGIKRTLAESDPSVCGLIAASCTLDDKQLESLQSILGMEDDPRLQHVYERQSGVLAVFCRGMKLSRTHFLALEVKEFLHKTIGHQGGVAISSFSAAGGVHLLDIDDMLQRLTGPASNNGKIHICNRLPNGEKQPSVLIIDDDASAGEFLNSRLQMKGYEVHQAYDGLQGIRLCEQLSPDVVITELTLPVYDGYQVIRKLQQNDRVDSKIIVLSERSREQDVSACFEMGVADYVKKPYSPVELEARLRRLLS